MYDFEFWLLVSFALMQFVSSGCQKNGIFAGFPRVQDKSDGGVNYLCSSWWLSGK